ncbi:ribbon-helix-helix domain-containing protein [Streptomyces cellulosae]|uniref:ribbon-helix-helix domain-containing protein n=1 Tax=Streptomyces cellulosae TaxID=1968 RepID=UPI0036B2CE8A
MTRTPAVVSVRMTEQFAEDLEVLQRGGMSASDAVRHAVRIVAQGQRAAERQAQQGGGRRPGVMSIPTIDLYGPRPPSDGPEQPV